MSADDNQGVGGCISSLALAVVVIAILLAFTYVLVYAR